MYLRVVESETNEPSLDRVVDVYSGKVEQENLVYREYYLTSFLWISTKFMCSVELWKNTDRVGNIVVYF